MENPGDKVEQIQAEALSLFKGKNEQYGNAFAKYGTVGVMIRMGEKINRLLSVNRLKIELKDEETLRDTLLDLLNYSSMALKGNKIQTFKERNEPIVKKLFEKK